MPLFYKKYFIELHDTVKGKILLIIWKGILISIVSLNDKKICKKNCTFFENMVTAPDEPEFNYWHGLEYSFL